MDLYKGVAERFKAFDKLLQNLGRSLFELVGTFNQVVDETSTYVKFLDKDGRQSNAQDLRGGAFRTAIENGIRLTVKSQLIVQDIPLNIDWHLEMEKPGTAEFRVMIDQDILHKHSYILERQDGGSILFDAESIVNRVLYSIKNKAYKYLTN